MTDQHNINLNTKNPENLVSRRRFFYQSGATLFTATLLASCGKLVEDVVPETETPDPTTEVPPAELDKTLAFFGDSLTIGAGGTAPYGAAVAAALQGRPVLSDGIVGQGAASIAVRQGGTPLKISVEGNKLDSIKPLKVNKLSNMFLSTPSRTEEYSRTGTLLGVRCTIRRLANTGGDEQYTIAPATVSTIAVPPDSEFILEDAAKLKTATQILWYGTNNVGEAGAEAEIIGALDSSIAYITAPARYVVLGVLIETGDNKGTANFTQAAAINDKLAAKYGKAFVPMTPPTDAELAAISYTPTAEDRTDLANLNFPRGLRANIATDAIHLNDKGYQIIANRVIAKLKELKY